MKNLDLLKQQKTEILQKMKTALGNDDTEAFAAAWEELQSNLQDCVLSEARGIQSQIDSGILAARGVRQLTGEETKYYERVIEAMRSAEPKQALSNLDVVMPKTVIDEVFKYLVNEHPLLSEINFQNTSGLIEYVVNTNTKQLATWGTLTSEITKELTGGFKRSTCQ